MLVTCVVQAVGCFVSEIFTCLCCHVFFTVSVFQKLFARLSVGARYRSQQGRICLVWLARFGSLLFFLIIVIHFTVDGLQIGFLGVITLQPLLSGLFSTFPHHCSESLQLMALLAVGKHGYASYDNYIPLKISYYGVMGAATKLR